jgi:hypothetical protein
MRKRLSGEEATPGLATPLDLCSVEDHGHHLQKEKAVTAKTFSLRPVANSVNVSKSEEDVPPLT